MILYLEFGTMATNSNSSLICYALTSNEKWCQLHPIDVFTQHVRLLAIHVHVESERFIDVNQINDALQSVHYGQTVTYASELLDTKLHHILLLTYILLLTLSLILCIRSSHTLR